MSPYVLKVISPAQLNIWRSKRRNCLLCHFSKALYLLNFFFSAFLLLFMKTLQSSLEQAIKCTDGWANRNKTKIRPSHRCEKVRPKKPDLCIAVFFKHSSILATLELLRKYIYLPDHCCNRITLWFLIKKKWKQNLLIQVSVIRTWHKHDPLAPAWTKSSCPPL